MPRAGLRALLSHWRRKPLQLATLILGLALATALWSGVQALNAEARASYAEAAAVLGNASHSRLLPENGGSFPQAAYVSLRRAGWLVSPIVDGRKDIGGNSFRIIGIDPLTAPTGLGPRNMGITGGIAGFITAPGQVFANPDQARALSGALDADVVAASEVAPGLLYADIGIAQELTGLEGRVSRMILLPDQPRGLPPLEEAAPGFELQTPEDGDDIARLTGSFHLNLAAFGLLSFAVGLFIVQGTIGLSFEQRRPMLRTLRALGMPLRALAMLLAAELLILALAAGGLGMALGYLIAAALLPDVAATLRGLYGAEIPGALSLRPAWWIAGMAITIAGAALAGAGAMLKLLRMPLLAPARPRAWAQASQERLAALGAGTFALVLISIAAAAFGGGLIGGFVLLGALLIAAALALPILLHVLLGLAERATAAPIAAWFWADTRQQLPGLSLALMALLLALSANIGVGTMVGSFRLTFAGWLDQRLASELYVTAESDARGAALQKFLEDRADAVLPIWSIDARVAGLPAEIYGVADHPTYREHWPLLDALDDAWDRIASGQAVLINEQLALREDLSPGDPLDLPGSWSSIVGGVYSDYGNPAGQVLAGLPHLVARFPEIEKRRFGIRIPPAEAPALARALREEFQLPAGSIVDQASLKRFSLGIFERTFTVTAALNVLTLAVAGFAILTSLLTLAAVRQSQLAPIWALGLTRRRLAALELLRTLILAAITAIAALPTGLLLAWILLTVVNVEAFGWRLPMHVFPGGWLLLSALSLFAALLASLWPARRLARVSPAELLKVFAHER